MRIVGIDPGLSGAIASLSSSGDELGLVSVHDAPRLDAGRGTLSSSEIIGILEIASPGLVVIERQQAMPKQGVSSTFKTGYGFGLYMGILAALRLRHVVVAARVWQVEMYQGAVGEGKDRSLYVCGQLWPGYTIPKSKHGRADALLIAEYGRRKLV